ncbi:Protein tyrosine kinase/Protein kinase domain/Kinase-like [Leishmania naiffi]|uniref:Serine/threonine-protein kinase PLK n=1 Tax=Leishmania naiffi TaxID=5678 RepID=A0AAW3BYL9_9TRYP
MERLQRVGARPGPNLAPDAPTSTSELPKPTFQPGSSIYEMDSSGRLHRFQCGRVLGRGGFAKCYEVSDETGTYALKAVNRASLEKPKTLQKLHSEISIHRRMKHKHVVEFLRTFRDRYYVYMLLEKCDHGTLMDLLKVRRFTVAETQYVMLQCLSALQYMHSECVIHRDLKPGNIMLDRELNIKIGDFGLAAELQYDGERKRTICGTPNYIAPEIIDHKSHGHSYEVDTWSLGVILYTLLVGQPPFQMEDVESTYKRIRQCRYDFPASVPDNARDLITQILQSSPAHRPTLMDIRQHSFFSSSPPPPLTPPASLASFGLPVPGATASAPMTTTAAVTITRCARRGPVVDMHHPLPAPYGKDLLGAPAQREVLRPINANVPPPHGAPTSPRHLANLKQQQVTPTPTLPGIDAHARGEIPRSAPATAVVPLSGRCPASPQQQRRDDANADEEEKQQLTALHDHLHQTLCGDATAADAADSEAPPPPVWVTQCADFSSKYGMAYRLSTGQTGAHFNDSTKIVWEPITDRVEYYARVKIEMPARDGGTGLFAKDELQVFSMHSYPPELEKKVTLTKYFKTYLSRVQSSPERVAVVACSPFLPVAPPRCTDPHTSSDFVYVKRWLRVDSALVFRLSNKTVQVCFEDGAEIILSSEWRVVTYTTPSGRRRTLPLSVVATEWEEAAERLRSTKSVLYQVIRDHCL